MHPIKNRGFSDGFLNKKQPLKILTFLLSGAKIFINTLWPELCGGHDDDRAVELKQPEESWGWVVNQGVKLIQTDRPALLLEYLEGKKLHD